MKSSTSSFSDKWSDPECLPTSFSCDWLVGSAGIVIGWGERPSWRPEDRLTREWRPVEPRGCSHSLLWSEGARSWTVPSCSSWRACRTCWSRVVWCTPGRRTSTPSCCRTSSWPSLTYCLTHRRSEHRTQREKPILPGGITNRNWVDLYYKVLWLLTSEVRSQDYKEKHKENKTIFENLMKYRDKNIWVL